MAYDPQHAASSPEGFGQPTEQDRAWLAACRAGTVKQRADVDELAYALIVHAGRLGYNTKLDSRADVLRAAICRFLAESQQ